MYFPNKVILGGLMYFRWIYPIERAMAAYMLYFRNQACPEGSIAEAYTVNKALTFCFIYVRGIETHFNRQDKNDDGVDTNPSRNLSVFKYVGRLLGKRALFYLNHLNT
ncbi:hypothetical protein PanWU01x14_205190 [Parasponia andersonii]|uniref:DUF4218 domain-containing protein n=1 Tax=Parasponia andersonii TaxID=3476 RepID=A0A2P5BW12_PARAD|nr:hypothetical protein PanWU01x14_205190 [Parasponia andersonii]